MGKKSKLRGAPRRQWWSLSRSDRRIMMQFYGFLNHEAQRRALEARLAAEVVAKESGAPESIIFPDEESFVDFDAEVRAAGAAKSS